MEWMGLGLLEEEEDIIPYKQYWFWNEQVLPIDQWKERAFGVQVECWNGRKWEKNELGKKNNTEKSWNKNLDKRVRLHFP